MISHQRQGIGLQQDRDLARLCIDTRCYGGASNRGHRIHQYERGIFESSVEQEENIKAEKATLIALLLATGLLRFLDRRLGYLGSSLSLLVRTGRRHGLSSTRLTIINISSRALTLPSALLLGSLGIIRSGNRGRWCWSRSQRQLLGNGILVVRRGDSFLSRQDRLGDAVRVGIRQSLRVRHGSGFGIAGLIRLNTGVI